MTSPADLEVLEEILIEAPRERVFHALTDPGEIATWWRLPGRYAVEDAEIDLRVGGEYRFSGVSSDDRPFLLTGVFLVVDPPRRLEYTWNPGWNDDARGSKVEIRLEAVGDHTRLVLRHSAFLAAPAREEHRQGWPAVLSVLAAHLGERAPDARRA